MRVDREIAFTQGVEHLSKIEFNILGCAEMHICDTCEGIDHNKYRRVVEWYTQET